MKPLEHGGAVPLTPSKAIQAKRKAIAKAQAIALHSASNRAPPAPDASFLQEIAQRLSTEFGLPLTLARKRVLALAVSAQPPPVRDSFQARGR